VGDEVKDTVKITVSNKGSGKALGTQDAGANGYMVDLILSTDKNVPVQFATLPNPYTFKEDMLLKGGRLSNTDTLAPGASRVYSVATPPPIAGLIPPGTPSKVYLCAVVDPGKKINESNENNNVDFRPISIAP
jgi:hypothetical protein